MFIVENFVSPKNDEIGDQEKPVFFPTLQTKDLFRDVEPGFIHYGEKSLLKRGKN